MPTFTTCTSIPNLSKVFFINITFADNPLSSKIPDGFSKDSANQQFISLLKQMAPMAQKYGITVCIETLNKTETNFVNTITEGLEIVKAVDHQNIMLLADFYHIMKEGESPEVIIKAGKYIKHCHIAEKEKPVEHYGP